MTVDEALLRTLTHAVQEALIEAMRVWPDDQPRDPKGWLVTVAWRTFLDATRAETSRRQREVRVEDEPVPARSRASPPCCACSTWSSTRG